MGVEVHIDGYTAGYFTDEYSVTLEPSCQFEISVNPYSDPDRIGEVCRKFYDLWTPIFAELGYHFSFGGNLEKVERGIIDPLEIPLSPKKRYGFMDRYFRTSGTCGKYMMRASASTQVSVDYSSEADMVRKLQILQKISPVLAIMMENKYSPDSVLQVPGGQPHLFRIQEWENLDPARTGFIPHSMDDDFGYEKLADEIFRTPLILLTDGGETTWVGSSSAKDLAESGQISEDLPAKERTALIEHFISMGFFHFRIKKYIEIRIADCVPLPKALGYTALLKGIVYSEESLATLEKELSDVKTADEIEEVYARIERDGLNAVIYGGKSARAWADHLKELAGASLPEKDLKHLAELKYQ